MLGILDILKVSIIVSVVQAGWNEYVEELENLKFQNSSTFQKHIQHAISVAEVPAQMTFPCEAYQLENKTTSVHYLRPGDIKVVGAMGDSITAGNGIRALTVFGSLVQFRGFSWSVGGQSDYEHNTRTLPNILKYYNPELTGYSVGIGPQGSEQARCNVAAPGNKVRDMPFQARLLVEKLKTLEGSSFQDDWKLITIFIGGNDLCVYCQDPDFYSAKNYTKFISEALDELAANVPRAFVNLVSLLDLSSLGDLKGGIVCELLHWKLCECALGEQNRLVISKMVKEYTSHLEELLASGRYDTREDFTVVLQPFLKDKDLPRLDNGEGDLSYFAYDCFHFNQKGHNALATALWNSMFQPVGKKTTNSSFTGHLYCPRKDEAFATAINSKNSIQIKIKENKITAVNQDNEQDGRQLHDVIQDGDNPVLGIMILSVISVAVVAYGTFFLFRLSVKGAKMAAERLRNNKTPDALRNALITDQPSTSYQSISQI